METSRGQTSAAGSEHVAPAQRRRLERFAVTESVDIHCHCLPGLDDGPGTLPEALELCRGLVEDGTTVVIATPHQLGRYEGRNRADAVRQGVDALNRALTVEGVPLRVMAGADVRLDERLTRLLSEGEVLTLADGGVYLLLELPHDTFIDPLPLLRRMVERGVRPLVSHPERNHFVIARPGAVETWLRHGAGLQLTAGSFAGDFGAAAQRAAWYWLETGQAGLVASDAHRMTGRPPRMTEAIRLISRRLGDEVARRVCAENPARVLDGRALEPPPTR
jgi:protein-tyrosine phosphatase